MKKDAISYNYWIYVLTCLAVTGVGIKLVGRDPGVQWDYVDIGFRLIQMFFFSTLAWFIGKKYHLHYSLICGLCFLILISATFLWRICTNLFFHSSFNSDQIWIIIWASLFGPLLLGGIIFIISFPFQFLLQKYKYKRNFSYLR